MDHDGRWEVFGIQNNIFIQKGKTMNYCKQEMPDLQGTGEQKSYFRPITYTNIHGEQLFKRMGMDGSGLSEEAMRAAVRIIRETLIHYLSLGHTVTIDGLGSFRLSLGLKEGKVMEPTDDEADETKRNAQSVEVKKVLFRVDRGLLQDLNMNVSLERRETKRLKTPGTTKEERLQMALDYLDRHAFFRVADYAELTGLSVSASRRELNVLVADETSGLKTNGRGTHIVYVKENEK